MAGFITGRLRTEIGIMAGCAILPLIFTVAVVDDYRAPKWVASGER